MTLEHIGSFLIGIVIGFLGGLFGKGGSAVATPLLHMIGVPGFVAVTSPLPATIPGTLIASIEYWRSHLLDRETVVWSIAFGVPATIAGSFLTEVTGAAPLLAATGLLVLGFGLTVLISPREKRSTQPVDDGVIRTPLWRVRLILTALGVGLVSGLLANSGGFLLAPAYARFLHLRLKQAFACSLAVSIFLAVPGTVVHTLLGHIDWSVTIWLALGSVPFSYLGARFALRTDARKLERWYGAALTILGILFALHLQ